MMRQRGRRPLPMKPKPRLLIVCEGRRTEPNYFEGFRRENRNVVISVCESPGKTPLQIVRHALRKAKELDIGMVAGDSAWCVFDVDECEDKAMRKAIDLAGDEVDLAVSNPCFEVWFLLHYTYAEKRMDTCRDVITELRRYISGYDKSADHFERLRPLVSTAVLNAERLERGRIGMGYDAYMRDANPCTNVHDLVKTMIGGPDHPMKSDQKR